MKVSEIRVGAVIYHVNAVRVYALWIDAEGAQHHVDLGTTTEFLPKIDALRQELRDTMRVARGQVPQLHAFMEHWGCHLLPEGLIEALPDVVVIVPHAILHDLPFHLVRCGAANEPLGMLTGVTYSSSMALFARCASRNSARYADLAAWTFDASGQLPPQNCPTPRTIVGCGTDVLDGKHDQFCRVAQEVDRFLRGNDSRIFCPSDGFPVDRYQAKAAFRVHPDVVCITAHGYVDPLDHLLSGLMLQHGDILIGEHQILRPLGRFTIRDLPMRPFPVGVPTVGPAEILTAAELTINAELDARLVILLGCSAGWGRVLQGDEPASLAETFLHTGAISVLAPLWDSEFDAGRQWILHFFQAWVAQGQPKALAARYATRKLYDDMGGERPERYGVLTLRGDWL